MLSNPEDIYKFFCQSKKVCIDSRRSQKNAVFFAIKGERFDGNKFALDALSKGCSVAVVDDIELFNSEKNEKLLYVKNALKTLQEVAAIHRRVLDIPIIGITGSNGKTTTKELLSAVLAQKYRLSYTSGNQNNHIGVPLTILAMNSTVDIGVVEMGANQRGDIKELCNICKPDYGLITNIGIAHTEGFKTFEGIKKTKNELYKYLIENEGTIFVNSDNNILLNLLGDYENSFTYGKSENAFCQGTYSEKSYSAIVKWKSGSYFGCAGSQLIGDYNFENILAAICIGRFFEIPSSAIDKAISSYSPSNNRSQYVSGTRNKIIFDLYNANPTSMHAAINNFLNIDSGNNKKCLILGDMLELGKYEQQEHKKILDFIADKSFDQVLLVGEVFKQFEKHYDFLFFDNSKSLASYLIKNPSVGKFYLVKGSRGIKLEKCTDYL